MMQSFSSGGKSLAERAEENLMSHRTSARAIVPQILARSV